MSPVKFSPDAIIIGGGPSAALSKTNYDKFKETSSRCCRVNHFYIQSADIYGPEFDDWYFASADHDMIARALLNVNSGRYRFSRVVTSSPNAVGIHFLPNTEIVNPWLAFASNPIFAEYYLRGRTAQLPTSGLQALHFYLNEGFRTISVIGLDFYSNPAQRYAFQSAADVIGLRHAKVSGYEAAAHSLTNDLIYLKLLLESYPDFRLISSSEPTVWRGTVLPFLEAACGSDIGQRVEILDLDKVRADAQRN